MIHKDSYSQPLLRSVPVLREDAILTVQNKSKAEILAIYRDLCLNKSS